MMKPHIPVFQNPQLEGNSFYWQGNSTGVLLMHGFTATTAEVRLLANAFRKKGWTISAPLLPGHGSTPQAMNRVQFQDWIDCVELAYQEIHKTCKNVIVGGESMGAVLSLYLAEQHPDIDALLLYSPALRVESLKYVSLLKYFFPILEKSNNDPEDHLWQGYTVNPLWAADQFRKLQKLVTDNLNSVRQPALILQGIYDKTIHPDCGRMIHNRIQSNVKELDFLEESGHVILLGKELDLIIDTSLAFLQGVDIL
jgi:carboxylesterase